MISLPSDGRAEIEKSINMRKEICSVFQSRKPDSHLKSFINITYYYMYYSCTNCVRNVLDTVHGRSRRAAEEYIAVDHMQIPRLMPLVILQHPTRHRSRWRSDLRFPYSLREVEVIKGERMRSRVM